MMDNILNQIADSTNTAALPYITILFRILLSFVAGFVLGLERKTRLRNIGIRTLILICVSSAILMMLSIHVSSINPEKGDPSRIAAQVVSGIGFLGAGAIMRQGLNVKGLTSAAIIWSASAMGLCIGAGLYIMGFSTLIISVLSLIILEKFEVKFFPAERLKQLEIIFATTECNLKQLSDMVESHGLIISNTDILKNFSENRVKIIYSVQLSDHFELQQLSDNLMQVAELCEISLKD